MTGFLACIIVAIGCGLKAVGGEPQTLFSADHVWLWWVPAIYWGLGSLSCLRRD